MLYDSDKIKPVTEENILQRTTEYDIYSYYIGKKIPVNTKFNSPLRKDDNPSFGLFVAKKSRELLFKDQGTGESGNCFKFVMLQQNLKSYKDALYRVNEDLNLGLLKKSDKGVTVKQKYKPSRTHIAVKKKNFSKRDLEYWHQYGISRETLRKFNVFPVKRVWVNGIMKDFIYTDKEPIYAFRVYNKFKIYRPYSPHRERFVGNCNKYDIQGLEQLRKKGDLLIITKSLKDVMVLHEIGYNAIAPNSESSVVPKEVMAHLKSRFNTLIVLYDNDKAGISGMLKMKGEYNIRCKFIPLSYEVKDVSDLYKKYGRRETIKTLERLTNVWTYKNLTKIN